MTTDNKDAMPQARVPTALPGSGLSWRDFFERLGNGTLQDAGASPRSRVRVARTEPRRPTVSELR